MCSRNGQDESTGPSDESLMLACRGGDLRSFEQLVLRYQTTAWGAAFRFSGDATEAEDVAQDAFLRIFEAAPRYQATAKFRTYLLGVVGRLCIDRAEKKRPIYVGELPETADVRETPINVATATESRLAVQNALARLPGNQRIAVILKYYEGLSYEDIATAMETTPKAVERLLARARESLEVSLRPLLD